MNLDDYIAQEEEKNRKQQEEERRKKLIPKWVHFYQNISTFDIPQEKLSLIKSFGGHITEFNFNSFPLPESDNGFGSFTMKQIKTTDNGSWAVLIEKPTILLKNKKRIIDDEEYNRRISTYQLVGAQEFYALDLCSLVYIEYNFGFSSNYKFYMFYSEDGKVFIHNDFFHIIKQTPTNELGNILAKTAIQIKQKKYPN